MSNFPVPDPCSGPPEAGSEAAEVATVRASLPLVESIVQKGPDSEVVSEKVEETVKNTASQVMTEPPTKNNEASDVSPVLARPFSGTQDSPFEGPIIAQRGFAYHAPDAFLGAVPNVEHTQHPVQQHV